MIEVISVWQGARSCRPTETQDLHFPLAECILHRCTPVLSSAATVQPTCTVLLHVTIPILFMCPRAKELVLLSAWAPVRRSPNLLGSGISRCGDLRPPDRVAAGAIAVAGRIPARQRPDSESCSRPLFFRTLRRTGSGKCSQHAGPNMNTTEQGSERTARISGGPHIGRHYRWAALHGK